MEKLQNKIKYKFIDHESELYDSAIDLRYREFFVTSNRTRESIFDEFEDESLRVVAYIDDKVIGHARLFIHESVGEITQVVVDDEYRGLKIGAEIMKRLVEKAEELDVRLVGLDARVYAVDFYKRFEFETRGEEYISKKSGMPIIKMERQFN